VRLLIGGNQGEIVKAIRKIMTITLPGMALLLGGCTLPGPKPSIPKSTYLLEGSESFGRVEAAPAAPCLTLGISIPQSAPGLTTSRIAYMEQPYRIDYFAYHEWADTPARMILSLLEERLDASGLFRAVVTNSGTVRPQLRLQTKILRLQQVFASTESEVELKAKITLFDVSRHSLLQTRTFALSEPAKRNNPYEGVVAANRAVERLLNELLDVIADTLAQMPCPEEE